MPQSRPRIGFIGFGTVAYHVAKGLHEEVGFHDIPAYCNGSRNYPPYTDSFRRRAASVGVHLVDEFEQLANRCDIIFSTVTAGATVATIHHAAPFLSERHLFADLNSTSPEVKNQVNELCVARGARFADCAILSSSTLDKHHLALWASGSGAADLARTMNPFQFNIRVIDDRPGSAAKVKLLRSVLMKSLEATLWETVLAAHEAGLDDAVREVTFGWLDTMQFSLFADFLLCTGALHAKRRVEELDEVIKLQESLGLQSVMPAAAKRQLSNIAGLGLKDYFNAERPSSYREVLEAIDVIKRGRCSATP